MTLIAFPPESLDRLALRLLDAAGRVRRMAERSREANVEEVQLHGNKPQEWLGRLETWVFDAETRLEAAVNRQRGARRARELPSSPPPKKKRRR